MSTETKQYIKALQSALAVSTANIEKFTAMAETSSKMSAKEKREFLGRFKTELKNSPVIFKALQAARLRYLKELRQQFKIMHN